MNFTWPPYCFIPDFTPVMSLETFYHSEYKNRVLYGAIVPPISEVRTVIFVLLKAKGSAVRYVPGGHRGEAEV